MTAIHLHIILTVSGSNVQELSRKRLDFTHLPWYNGAKREGKTCMIRPAKRTDAARMLEIYAPYVRDTAISLEYVPPTPAEFEARFDRIASKYPWIVWEEGERVMGYAYADVALSRAAYQWDADLSIYLAPEICGKGIGHILYDWMERSLRSLGYVNLYALVTSDNAASCRFHERRGYALLGVLKRSGFKFGHWHDVSWYGLRLTGDEPPVGPPRGPELL